MCVYISTHAYIHMLNILTYLYIYMYVCVCVCIDTRMHKNTYILTYVYIHTHTYSLMFIASWLVSGRVEERGDVVPPPICKNDASGGSH